MKNSEARILDKLRERLDWYLLHYQDKDPQVSTAADMVRQVSELGWQVELSLARERAERKKKTG